MTGNRRGATFQRNVQLQHGQDCEKRGVDGHWQVGRSGDLEERHLAEQPIKLGSKPCGSIKKDSSQQYEERKSTQGAVRKVDVVK